MIDVNKNYLEDIKKPFIKKISFKINWNIIKF